MQIQHTSRSICFPGLIYCDRTWLLFLGVQMRLLTTRTIATTAPTTTTVTTKTTITTTTTVSTMTSETTTTTRTTTTTASTMTSVTTRASEPTLTTTCGTIRTTSTSKQHNQCYHLVFSIVDVKIMTTHCASPSLLLHELYLHWRREVSLTGDEQLKITNKRFFRVSWLFSSLIFL